MAAIPASVLVECRAVRANACIGFVLSFIAQSQHTPLQIAVAEGHEACVRLLLERGADPEITSVRGTPPMTRRWRIKYHSCNMRTRTSGRAVFLCLPCVPQRQGRPLYTAVRTRQPRMCIALMNAGADVRGCSEGFLVSLLRLSGIHRISCWTF